MTQLEAFEESAIEYIEMCETGDALYALGMEIGRCLKLLGIKADRLPKIRDAYVERQKVVGKPTVVNVPT